MDKLSANEQIELLESHSYSELIQKFGGSELNEIFDITPAQYLEWNNKRTEPYFKLAVNRSFGGSDGLYLVPRLDEWHFYEQERGRINEAGYKRFTSLEDAENYLLTPYFIRSSKE